MKDFFRLSFREHRKCLSNVVNYIIGNSFDNILKEHTMIKNVK